jgi:capsular polysaccharide biosynthesis protein
MDRPQSLVVIEDAVVRETVGFVRLPDGQVCLEGNWNREFVAEHPAYRRRLPYRRRRLQGNIYSLLSYWSQEYYHWFHDVLPRLHTSLPHLPSDTRYLINEQARPYQLESLKAFGLTEAKLITQPDGCETLIERLWFATPLGHCCFSSGSALQAVRKRLVSLFSDSESLESSRRIYISRSQAKCRRILNEEELVSRLRPESFVILHCEDLSLREQVRLFSEAAILVGPHGAGLTNMLFARPGAFVLELAHAENTRVCYATLAAQLGHDYQRCAAQAVEPKGDDADLFADLDRTSEIVNLAKHEKCAGLAQANVSGSDAHP